MEINAFKLDRQTLDAMAADLSRFFQDILRAAAAGDFDRLEAKVGELGAWVRSARKELSDHGDEP